MVTGMVTTGPVTMTVMVTTMMMVMKSNTWTLLHHICMTALQAGINTSFDISRK